MMIRLALRQAVEIPSYARGAANFSELTAPNGHPPLSESVLPRLTVEYGSALVRTETDEAAARVRVPKEEEAVLWRQIPEPDSEVMAVSADGVMIHLREEGWKEVKVVSVSAVRLGNEQAGAVFLLLSRSHVVDFDALTELPAAGRFRAGIDVFPEEPLPKDHPIRRVKHAVLSSHRAGAMLESLQNIGRIVADDIEAICSGLVPQKMQVAQPEYIRLRG